MNQSNVLKYFLEKWTGATMDEHMKPTDADRIRAFAILYSDDNMREFIPFVLAGSDKSQRLTQDE